MAGHSKWSTIKRKKGEKDGARAKVFTKISREVLVCIRETGSADPANNSRLKDLIAKAKANNIPNENIERLLKKAQGGDEKNDYENCLYEGYGIGGVAVMVSCLTDNRNRTAGEIRHYFDKYGGNLGTAGCVAFMFSEKGIVIIEKNEKTTSETNTLEDDIIESGAVDFTEFDDYVEIETEPNDLRQVSEYMQERNYKILSAEIEMIPSTYTTLTDEEQVKKMTILLEMLEDNDDVQNVWNNWE
ncbi:MAG: YebC/PmpR family DNA-binding transcriptional regulator [Oscillospiraceae bacterium]|nr:YebC/PmpR family DNA-binding transcriptional regulator [Oscillospiraceae bacterium]